MSTVGDYLGRKSDVSAFSGYTKSNEAKLTQALFGDGYSGSVCAGVVKLAQNFLTLFLADKGQLYYDANDERGCSFIDEVRKGHVYSEADVYSLFYLSATRVQNYLRTIEDAADPPDPDDERWGRVELTGVIIGDGSIRLAISITSLAGTNHSILLPIPVTP